MPAGGYENPPIEEALCEFRFAPGPEWDLTIPGRLHGKVQDLYSGKPRTQKVVSANVAMSEGGGPPALAMNQAIGRVQLPSEDGTRMLSVGPDVLTVHTLRPYDGWSDFKPRITSGLDAYRQVAEPAGLARLGVRYINRITIPEESLRLDDYFTAAPPSAPGLPNQMSGFLHRTEYVYEDGVKLLLTFASIEGEEPTFLLDIDVIWEGEEPRSLDEVGTLVDELHSREGKAFEDLIKEPLRRLFDAPA